MYVYVYIYPSKDIDGEELKHIRGCCCLQRQRRGLYCLAFVAVLVGIESQGCASG